MVIRPAWTSARMSRSDSNMAATLAPAGHLVDGSVQPPSHLQPMIADGHDRALSHPDPLADLAPRGHAAARSHNGSVGRSAVDDEGPVRVSGDGQVRFGDGPG